jgi:hypothetical protein
MTIDAMTTWRVIECTDGWHVWDTQGCEVIVGKGEANATKSAKLAKYLNKYNVNAKFCDVDYWISRFDNKATV